jgi:hypothetical protein
MNDPEVISFITEEMLTEPGIDAQFVIKVGKLAQEDKQMYKLIQLYMYFPDFDNEGKNETLKSIADYMRMKKLWSEVTP